MFSAQAGPPADGSLLVGRGGAFSSEGEGRRMTGPWLGLARSQALDAPRAKGTMGEGGLWPGSH